MVCSCKIRPRTDYGRDAAGQSLRAHQDGTAAIILMITLNNPSCGLATGLVKCIDKNKERELEHKAGGGDSVDILGKAGRKLTERGFHAFAKILE